MSRLQLVVGAALAALALATVVPASAAPADDAARIELGRRLFFDPALGRQGRIGCASCHDPEHGFSDARRVSTDESGASQRHSQPLTDLAGEGFHWDGEFGTVRDVIDARILPGVLPAKATAERSLVRLRATMNHDEERASAEAVGAVLSRIRGGAPSYYGNDVAGGTSTGSPIATRIARGNRYERGFRAAFGDDSVTSSRIGDALEAYLATLNTTTSPFDRFVAGDEGAISASARRGHALFAGRAGCAQCHVEEGPRPAFSDGKFHNTGVETSRVRRSQWTKTPVTVDPGRLAASFRFADRGAFKTPSLRDVARRAPYFHDASAATLADVVRYYDKVETETPDIDPRVRPLGLTDADVADLVAFLESLTGAERAGLGRTDARRSPRLVVHVECLDGSPVAGLRVSVRPFGDRLAPATRLPEPVHATTDARGDATVDMPASTHVVVDGPGVESSAMLPDWTTNVSLLFTPRDTVSLSIRFAADAAAMPERISVSASSGTDGSAGPEPLRTSRLFRLVRELGPAEGLYAAAESTESSPDGEARAALLDVGPEQEFDFQPGSHSRIDLRGAGDAPDPTAIDEVRRSARAIAELLSRDRRAK